MTFFKRLSRSRSRSNSQSYVDRYDDDRTNNNRAASYDEKYDGTPTEEHHSNPIARTYSESNMNNGNGNNGMYANNGRRPQQQSQQEQYSSPTAATSQYASGRQQPAASNGYGSYDKAPSTPTVEAAPDLLTQAFNLALRPHREKVDSLEAKIEGLEGENADLRSYIESLERQRSEVHAWIDKRGLRPGECLSREPVLSI